MLKCYETSSPFFPEFPVILNQFILEKLVGHGGSSHVWKIFDAKLNLNFAFKVGPPETIVAEYAIHERLDHPHIVPLRSPCVTFTHERLQYGGFTMDEANYDLKKCIEVNTIVHCISLFCI